MLLVVLFNRAFGRSGSGCRECPSFRGTGPLRWPHTAIRDSRVSHYSTLDQRRNPDVYVRNLPSDSDDPDADYLYVLETRDLIDRPAQPPPDPVAIAAALIRRIYYRSQRPENIPDRLFIGLDNEVRFGRASSSEATGGLSVPDTHVSTLTRRVGPRGDATFNSARWPGYTPGVKQKLEPSSRGLS